jgi:hypothetical protein
MQKGEKKEFNIEPGKYDNISRPDLDKKNFNKLNQVFSRVIYL